MKSAEHTICAPATPPGRSALAVVRISGPAVEPLLLERLGRLPPPRHASLIHWRSSKGNTLDRCLATWFRAPSSYTGEDLLELSLHGNPLLVRQVLDDLVDVGIRLATPGEFTRRAVAHRRLRLDEAEAVGATIEAETADALEEARRLLDGGLRPQAEPLRTALLDAWALLEMEADFAEEEDQPQPEAARAALDNCLCRIEGWMADQDVRERSAIVPRVAVCGRANAGKSSLINAITGTDRLLVSHRPGTTRDWVEVSWTTPRGTLTFVDTAGLGDAVDDQDAMAQQLSRRALDGCGLRLVVVDVRQNPSDLETELLAAPQAWLVRSKSDLVSVPQGELAVSALTGEGLPRLCDLLLDRLLPTFPSTMAGPLLTARPRALVQRAHEHLLRAREACDGGHVEIAAFELRTAATLLEDLTGATSSPEMLDRIFASFCIGK